jgi:hypothetical protein
MQATYLLAFSFELAAELLKLAVLPFELKSRPKYLVYEIRIIFGAEGVRAHRGILSCRVNGGWKRGRGLQPAVMVGVEF